MSRAQDSNPIPNVTIGGDPTYGLFDSAQEACQAQLDQGLRKPNPSPSYTLLGLVVKSSIAGSPMTEGSVPYNTAGHNGWLCHAKYKVVHPTVPGLEWEELAEWIWMYPGCPSTYAAGTYPIGSGLDACPGNPQFFVSTQPEGNGAEDAQLVHDPIDPASGNVYTTEKDFEGAGLPFKRYYNSLDSTAENLTGAWRTSFGRRIVIVNSPAVPRSFSAGSSSNSSKQQTAAEACTSGFEQVKSQVAEWTDALVTYEADTCTISKAGAPLGILPIKFNWPVVPPRQVILGYIVERDDGTSVRFPVAGGVIWPPRRTNIRFGGSPTSGFIVVDEDDNVERYDASGFLMSVTSRTGYVQTLSYGSMAESGGQVTAVTDSLGHSLQFGYDTYGRLNSVTQAGLTTSYIYDAQSRLISVTHPDLTTRHYLYENAQFSRALTGLIDEHDVRVSTWIYDDEGRATSTHSVGGVGGGTVAYSSPSSVTVTDALGASRTFNYDRVGDRKLVVSISGSQCPTCTEPKSTSYDENGWVSSRTDYNGNVTRYTREAARGLELIRKEAFGTPRVRTVTTAWHPTYRLPTSVSTYGGDTTTGTALQTLTFSHDAQGNVQSQTIADPATSTSRTWTFTYNDRGQVLTADGPRTDVADVSTYTYYDCAAGFECGQLATVTNALGQLTTINSYNAVGQPLTITDLNGVLTILEYDNRRRLTSRTVNGEVTSIEYWPTGLVKRVTLPDNSYVEYGYDLAHRLNLIQDSEGNKVVYTLDAMGNRTNEEVFDPSGELVQTQASVFSQLSRLHKVIGAANTAAVTTTFGYDDNGNATSVNAPLARNGSSVYDELNRIESTTDPSGTTHIAYNPLDQLISVTDPRNLVTNYTYNGLGDLQTQSSPDTGTTTNTFDSAGNLKTSKDAKNKTTTYTYDALDRVTQVAFGDQTISYGYDVGVNGVGRLTSSSDANHAQSWTYDGLGRVLSKTQTVGAVTSTQSYTYTNGQLTNLKTPSGANLGYTFANGKVTGITVNGVSLLNNVLYEPFGPTNGWTWGNGTFAVRIYDTDGKITQIDSAGLKSYGYDDAFRITSITDTASPSNSWSYGYDTMDRLTNASSSGITQGFTFDADGNRLTQSGTSNTTFSYPATSNKLLSATGSLSKTYTYDATGNILSDGTLVYTYNNRGRMKTAKNGTASAVTYTYDGFGQRIKKTGTTRIFVYDEAGHLQGEYNASGTMVQEFVWLGDIPVAVLTPKTGGVNIFYIHTDHLNTPRKITRPSDNKLRWTYNPDAYGNGAPNNNPAALGAFTFNPRFPGQYFDSETGNHYNYYRDYNPSTGRYVQSDPIGLMGGVNTFGYVDNNPTTEIDPTGELGIIGAVFGAGFDLAYQTLIEGKSLNCVNWTQVGIAGALGAIGGGAVNGAFKLSKGSMKASNVLRRYRRVHEVPRTHDVHHWLIEKGSRLGKQLPDSIVNHPANLTPLERAVHQGIHNGKYNPLEKWWRGTPEWAKSFEGSLGAGAAAEAADDECGCK